MRFTPTLVRYERISPKPGGHIPMKFNSDVRPPAAMLRAMVVRRGQSRSTFRASIG